MPQTNQELLDQIVLFFGQEKCVVNNHLISFICSDINYKDRNKLILALKDPKYLTKEFKTGWINLNIQLIISNYGFNNIIDDDYALHFADSFEQIFNHKYYKDFIKSVYNKKILDLNKNFLNQASKQLNNDDLIIQLKKIRNLSDLVFINKLIKDKENENNQIFKETIKNYFLSKEKRSLLNNLDHSGKILSILDYCDYNIEAIYNNYFLRNSKEYYNNNGKYKQHNVLAFFKNASINLLNKLNNSNKFNINELLTESLRFNDLRNEFNRNKNNNNNNNYNWIKQKVSENILAIFNSQKTSVHSFVFVSDKLKDCIIKNNDITNYKMVASENPVLWVLKFLQANEDVFGKDSEKLIKDLIKIEKKIITKDVNNFLKDLPAKEVVVKKVQKI